MDGRLGLGGRLVHKTCTEVSSLYVRKEGMDQFPCVLLGVPGQCVRIFERMVVRGMIPGPGGAPRTYIRKHERGTAFGIELCSQVQLFRRAERGGEGLETRRRRVVGVHRGHRRDPTARPGPPPAVECT